MKFKDKILDNVHGFIELTEVECRIIELPIYKRLRQLKQLSLADWIFPGAEHTRYIHSLGVMHIADKIALKLNFSDEDRQLVRLAGLLHDLGHYPLSHVGEAAYMNDKKVTNAIQEQFNSVKAAIETIPQDRSLKDYMKQAGSPKHHERITETVISSDTDIKEIILKECPYISIQDICDIITGSVERNPELSAKVQIMHSELDADRIDYIMRDAIFSGTSFGGFELGMLLDNLTIQKQNGIEIVGVKPKGISSADQFLVNRFFSYSQIIYNKHVEILGFMAKTWIEHCIKKGLMTKKDEFEMMVKCHNSNRQYLLQTDTKFWSTLSETENIIKDEYLPTYIKKIAAALSDYSELAYIPDSEKKIISSDVNKVYNLFQGIQYKENVIPIFERRSFTDHIPTCIYEEKLKERDKSAAEPEEIIDSEIMQVLLTRRLQDGLAVIDGEDVHLLVDDDRSLMSTMYVNKLYLYREYQV